MTDGMGPYLEPSLIVGLGSWGGAVAQAAEEALRERSPALARACRALAAEPGAPDLPERVRTHLRVTRMADVIRALEADGLMRIDPIVSPPSNIYLITSLQDDPDLTHLTTAATLIDAAAAELKAKVKKVAIVDVVGGQIPAAPGFPLYVLEPVTAHGLVLDEDEYRAAAVELLVAAAQPGGSQVLADGGRGTGTLGISWLVWSPATLRESLAGRLSREALLRCIQAEAPPGRAPGALTEGRDAALLDRLPFVVGPCGDLQPGDPGSALWGRPTTRRLTRVAAVLERTIDRWTQRLRTNAALRARQELDLLQTHADQAVSQCPDGLARLRSLLAATARDAVRRRDDANTGAPPPPSARPAVPQSHGARNGHSPTAPLRQLRQRLTAAEALPTPQTAAIALGASLLIFTLIWWLAGGKALSWLGGTAFQLFAFAAYLAIRGYRIRRARLDLVQGLTHRATAAITEAYSQACAELDQQLEDHCATLTQRLTALPNALGLQATTPTPQTPQQEGALNHPLIDPDAAAPIYRELQQLLPDLAARLASSGALRHWQDPPALDAAAEAEVRLALAERPPLDPAQAVTRAYGSHLAPRLRTLVDQLLEWSQPLLARPIRLPEGRRWLLWPEGLPCPPVPQDITVLPYARSCIAIVHVVTGLPASQPTKTGTA